jgi:hypothetical protein
MTRRIGAVAGALALQVIALVLAHDLTFLARYGSRYGEGLIHAGHGQAWTGAVASSVLLTLILALVAAAKLLQLRARARGLRGAERLAGGRRATSSLLRVWLRMSARVGLAGIALLTVQENLERLAIGQAAPGPLILLSPEYPFGLWIALAVGAAVGLVAALFEHRRRVLLTRIRAARQVHPGGAATRPVWRHEPDVDAAESILGRRSGLRAPPVTTPA